ncbi:ROK family transcriptional regulator [Streptacidiphilus sp. PAMC 29251]
MTTADRGGPLRPNRQRALEFLGRVGEASRAQLARELGLPKATVADLVAELLARGMVTEATPADRNPTPGRPAQVLSLSGPAAAVACLEWSLGDVRATVATLTGRVLSQATVTVAADQAQGAVLDQFVAALGQVAEAAGYAGEELRAVVLSVPAPTYRGDVSPLPAGAAKRYAWTPPWLDQGLAAALEQRAGIPALLENDANLCALGEHAFGAGRGNPDQVYLKVSRHGVGAGLILGDRLHRGSTGLAGELAHVQVHDNGPLCACGGRGCLIRVIGTDMIDLAQPAYEQPLDFATILALAEDGDLGLQRLLVDLGRTLGRPLADLCTLLNPDLFILDGSLGPAGAHIIAGLTEAITRHAQPATAAQVLPGQLGPQAAALGAVALLRGADVLVDPDPKL